MKIEAEKYYEQANGAIHRAMKASECEGCDIRVGDGYFQSSSWKHKYNPRLNIVREVYVAEPLPFELKAGERYELDNGEVVKLEQADLRKGFRKHFPFAVCGKSYSLFAMATGELMHGDDPEYFARIVRPYVEPKPPTLIEQLESLTHEFGGMTSSKCVEIRDDLLAIIADLKATVKP